MTKPRIVRDALHRLAALLEHLSADEATDKSAAPAPQKSADAWKELWDGMRFDVHETARAALMCFACNALVPIEREETVIRETLMGSPPGCAPCGVPIDVWTNTRFAMAHESGLALAAQVGARHTAILYRLGVGELATIDLREKGVPADAVILRVVHRASLAEGLGIVDIDATDSARAPGHSVRVLGVRLSETDATDMQAQTTVTWAAHDADDDGRRSLNRALLAVATGRLEEAIIPANVAVEVTLARVLAEHLRGLRLSEKRIAPFMTEAATYSHQVNVLLPLVLAGTPAPPMSDHLRGILNRLRALRNDAGHRGKAREPLTADVVGECVAGAVFGFHYVRLAADFLAEARARTGG
jgi:hypothetical protein